MQPVPVWLSALVVVAFGAAVAYALVVRPAPPGAPVAADGVFFDAANYLQLTPLPNWRRAEPQSAAFRPTLGLWQFGFTREGSTCALAYTAMSDTQFGVYQQTSFLKDFIYTRDHQQLSGYWFVLKTETPEGFEFQWEGKQPMQNEVLMVKYSPVRGYGPVFGVFVLYDTMGSVVSDECTTEVRAMLGTVEEYWERTTLTQDKTGYVFFRLAGEAAYSPLLHLVFVGPDAVGRELLQVQLNYDPEPTLYKSHLYYVASSTLHKLDPRSGTSEVVPLPLEIGYTINDFFMRHGSVWYLAGFSCTGYLERCDNELWSYEMSTGKARKYASDIPAGSIDGWGAEAGALYVSHGFGDAGCFGIDTYRVEGMQLVPSEHFGGCSEEPGYAEQAAGYAAYRNQFAEQVLYSDHWDVVGGVLRMPSEPELNPPLYSAYPLRTVAE